MLTGPASDSQRFEHTNLAGGGGTKIDTFVQFPLELDMTPYLSSTLDYPTLAHKYVSSSILPTYSRLTLTFDLCRANRLPTTQKRYNLLSVVAHEGSLSQGHYTSYVRGTDDVSSTRTWTVVVRIAHSSVILRATVFPHRRRQGSKVWTQGSPELEGLLARVLSDLIIVLHFSRRSHTASHSSRRFDVYVRFRIFIVLFPSILFVISSSCNLVHVLIVRSIDSLRCEKAVLQTANRDLTKYSSSTSFQKINGILARFVFVLVLLRSPYPTPQLHSYTRVQSSTCNVPSSTPSRPKSGARRTSLLRLASTRRESHSFFFLRATTVLSR